MKTRFKIIISVLILTTLITVCNAQPNTIINAFKQGNVKGGGNCASIAGIKAAIGKFGVGNVFVIKKLADTLYAVSLRSGDVLFITPDEIKNVEKQDGFKTFNLDPASLEIKAYADTSYAVMCKNFQVTTNENRLFNYELRLRKIKSRDSLQTITPLTDNIEEQLKLIKEQIEELGAYITFNKISLQEAINKLNNGSNAPEVASLLGVHAVKIRSTLKNIRRNDGAIMNSPKHAVYTTGGIYDETKCSSGTAKLSAFRWKRKNWKKLFFMLGPSSAYVLIQ